MFFNLVLIVLVSNYFLGFFFSISSINSNLWKVIFTNLVLIFLFFILLKLFFIQFHHSINFLCQSWSLFLFIYFPVFFSKLIFLFNFTFQSNIKFILYFNFDLHSFNYYFFNPFVYFFFNFIIQYLID